MHLAQRKNGKRRNNKLRSKMSETPKATLRVWVEQSDGVFSVSRPAPILPAGISWHEGMRFYDNGLEDSDWMLVDYIGVNPSGDVEIGFNCKFHAPMSTEAVSEFTDHGWTLDAQ